MNPAEKARRRRARRVLLCLALLLVGLMLVSFRLGRYPATLKETLGILVGRWFGVEPFWDKSTFNAVWNVRFPRILLSCLVGLSLSAAGSVYQGLFQNPMASPDILGATKGAAFGAAMAIFLGLGSQFITLAAFVSGIAAVSLVWLVGRKTRGKQVLGLILAGIMVSSLFEAGTSILKVMMDPDDQLPALTFWLMGGLNGVKWSNLGFALPGMVVGLVPLFLLRWRLNLLTLGDEEARAMGVNAKAVRLVAILGSTLATAAAVSVSGSIGWVGLVVPHIARRLVGNDYRYLLPASALTGAVFLLVVDNISRTLMLTEIPLGILTAFVGAPFFLWLIIKGGERV